MPARRQTRHPLTGDPPRSLDDNPRLPPGRLRPGTPTRSPIARPAATPRSSAADVLGVQSHLTDRDRTIIDWVDRHGVLTTTQLTAAFFTNPTTAAHRLARLRALGLLDRFHRPAPGAWFTPWHWVTGPLGALITAAARDTTPPTPRALRARHAALADSAKLPHLLGVNQFFVDLHVHARHHRQTQLVRWWSEPETATRYHGRIHPDGHALWRHRDHTIGIFLEHDRGTEALHRLVAKVAAYDQLASAGGPAYPILFWLPSPARETNLHRHLAQRLPGGYVPIATAVATPDSPGPAGPVWWLLGRPGRWAIHHLPHHDGDPHSPYNPALTEPDLDPLP
jgi:Replication-relaxation